VFVCLFVPNMDYSQILIILSICKCIAKSFTQCEFVGEVVRRLFLMCAHEGISNPLSTPPDKNLERLERMNIAPVKTIAVLVLRSMLRELFPVFLKNLEQWGIKVCAHELRLVNGQDNLAWVDVELNGVCVRIRFMPLGKKWDHEYNKVRVSPTQRGVDDLMFNLRNQGIKVSCIEKLEYFELGNPQVRIRLLDENADRIVSLVDGISVNPHLMRINMTLDERLSIFGHLHPDPRMLMVAFGEWQTMLEK
jgi:hypothetical protein